MEGWYDVWGSRKACDESGQGELSLAWCPRDLLENREGKGNIKEIIIFYNFSFKRLFAICLEVNYI